MNSARNYTGLIVGVIFLSACSHTSHIALLSNGDLEGKTLAGVKQGEILRGESCGLTYSLGKAMSKALEGSPYDTLVDINIESTSAFFVFGNCVKVTGKGVNSKSIPRS